MKLVRWIGIFVLVQAVAYFAVFQAQLEEIEKLEVSIPKLKDEYLGKKKQAVNLDLYREQLREADTVFGKLLTALPDRSSPNALDREFPALLRAARARGLRVEELRPDTEEHAREFYAELAVRLKVSGRFHDLGAFTADLAKAPRILLLHDLSLDPSVTPGLVTMGATVRVFRYLDDEELAAQRKRARAAKGAKG